jgi:antitoxin FitA
MLAMLAFMKVRNPRVNEMASLMVRNVNDDVVKALKARAGLEGISAEAEHRKILEEALLRPKKKSFVDILMDIPTVGEDTDFDRIQDKDVRDVFN